MLSKKYYEEFAKILRTTKSNVAVLDHDELMHPTTGQQAISMIEAELIGYFGEDNHRFDPERFRKACKL
jgi:hypothetical protein